MSRRRRSKSSISSRRGGGTVTKTKTNKKNNRQTEINRKQTKKKPTSVQSLCYECIQIRDVNTPHNRLVSFSLLGLFISFTAKVNIGGTGSATSDVTSYIAFDISFSFSVDFMTQEQRPSWRPLAEREPLSERETPLRERPVWERGRERDPLTRLKRAATTSGASEYFGISVFGISVATGVIYCPHAGPELELL